MSLMVIDWKMIFLLSFILFNYETNSHLDNSLPCPKSSKYYTSLKKAYDKYKNSDVTINYENSILGSYSECVLKFYIPKMHKLNTRALENNFLHCCSEKEYIKCREIWAPHTLSCLIQKLDDIDGSNDEKYLRREVDQNYQLTTRLKNSLKEENIKFGFSKSSSEDDEHNTKWLPCPTESKYLKTFKKSFLQKDNQTKTFEETSNLGIFSQCFVKYIVEKGPKIYPEMEYALYECCNGLESPECEKQWTINILSCWIEHRYFDLEPYYNTAVSINIRNRQESTKVEAFKLEPQKKKISLKKMFSFKPRK